MTMRCLPLSLCYFVTVAEAGICQGTVQVVAGGRVHNAARGSGSVFMGADLGAAGCSWLWHLFYALHRAARSLRKRVGNAVFGRGCSSCRSGTSTTQQTNDQLFLNERGKDMVGKVLQVTGETSIARLQPHISATGVHPSTNSPCGIPPLRGNVCDHQPSAAGSSRPHCCSDTVPGSCETGGLGTAGCPLFVPDGFLWRGFQLFAVV